MSSTTYTENQYDMCYPTGIEHHWWTVARNKLLANILRQEGGESRPFLEVGCGRGLVVKSLKDSGLNIRGVELADVRPTEGAQLLVDTNTDACDWATEHGSDITGLLLLDVIEHLPEPEEFLKKLVSSFPNLAVVVITVPTCKELWSNYDDYYGHHRRYSLKMLATLSQDLNWTTKSMGYFFRISYFPMLLMSLLGVKRNLSFTAPGKAMRPLHRLVSSLSHIEQSIIPRRIKGTSAYAVYHLNSAKQ
ncbi:MAG: hypothetical protein ACI9JM_002179 [Halioglobus sp.]|jgi:hypothetical protein